MHARIERITRRFTQLDAKLKQLLQGSEEYKVETDTDLLFLLQSRLCKSPRCASLCQWPGVRGCLGRGWCLRCWGRGNGRGAVLKTAPCCFVFEPQRTSWDLLTRKGLSETIGVLSQKLLEAISVSQPENSYLHIWLCIGAGRGVSTGSSVPLESLILIM